MSESKPRLTRLTAILTQLQSKRLVTATDLADKHGVSIRTVYRDIRTLEESGVPIVTEEGRGYSMMEGYRLPPIMFTQEEANALVTAELLIQKNKDGSLVEQYESAVCKVRSVLKNNQKVKTEMLTDRLQVRSRHGQEKTSDHLIKLQSAISEYTLVRIDYLSVEDLRSQREIEPFALYTTQDNWLLIAYCRLRKAFRAFRLDRIEDLLVLDEHFEPHDMTLQQYLDEYQKIILNTPDIPLTEGGSTFVLNQKGIQMKEVKVEPFKLIGIAVRTTNENGQAANEIGALWGRFMAEDILNAIPGRIDNTIYSMYTEYEGDHTQSYTAILGCKVASLAAVPLGMKGVIIKGGTYMKTSAKGDLMKGMVVDHWSKIFDMGWDRNFNADFETFGEKAQNPADAEVDFFVGVKD